MNALGDISQWPATLDPAESMRRSVYMYVKRTFRLPMLETFDVPDSQSELLPARCDQRGAAGAGADEQRIRVWRGPGSLRSGCESWAAKMPEAWVSDALADRAGTRAVRSGTRKALAMLDAAGQNAARWRISV